MQWSVARLFFVYGPRQLAAGGYPSVIVRNFERIRPWRAAGRERRRRAGARLRLRRRLRRRRSSRSRSRRARRLTVNLASGHAMSVEELTRAMLARLGIVALEPVAAPSDWTAGTRAIGDHGAGGRSGSGGQATTPLEVGLRRVWESLRVSVELSVIAPCLNEEANLAALCTSACSPPSTAAQHLDGAHSRRRRQHRRHLGRRSRALAEEFPGRVRGVRHERNQGIAAAWRSGVGEATRRLLVLHRRRPPEPARAGRDAVSPPARVAGRHRAGHTLEHRAAP